MTRYVDESAKFMVKLVRQSDRKLKPYYIGKLQFPGRLDFEKGISFKIKLDDKDNEHMLIGPIRDLDKSEEVEESKGHQISGAKASAFGRLSIDLRKNDNDYVAEAICPAFLDTTEGLFFAVFVSREGAEELQISRLNHNRKRTRSESIADLYNDDEDF